MAKPSTPATSNINTNNNTNNINVNVKVDNNSSKTKSKKKSPSYTKTVIGIIAVIITVAGYLIKKNLDDKGAHTGTITNSSATPVEGVRQN